MAKSRIDRLIDQAEETNRRVRELTEAILLSGRLAQSIPAPIPAKALLGVAPKAQELQSEAYFRALRGLASAVQNPATQQLVTDTGQIALDSVNLLPLGPSPLPAASKKPRTPAQKKNDKMQSQAFKTANSKLRTSKGALRKGVTQKDIAKRAQKELRRMKNKRGTTRSRRASGTPARKSPPRRSGGGRR